MTREQWREVDRVLRKPKVQLAMRGRCEEQDHQWENCMTPFYAVYQECKWCGERR